MKTHLNLFFALIVALSSACSRDNADDPVINKVPVGDSALEVLVEKDLTLKTDQRLYKDSSGNEYHTLVFDADHLSHMFKMTLEEGKKYRIAVIGDYSWCVAVSLLRSENDTLFRGESSFFTDINKNQIYWKATASGIYYLSVVFADDINFHTYTNRLIFEEITDFDLSASGLNLRCSGDWSVNSDGYLTLVMHETGTYRWVQIKHETYNYRFSYNVTQASGYPDNYIGTDCYASDEIFDMENVPLSGYLFEVKGPSEWRCSFWNLNGGVGYEYGFLNENLQGGSNVWHNMGVETFGDSIAYTMNGDMYKRFRNYMSFDKGLYIVVYDTKQDTVYFKDIKFE